ncbi:calcium/sodium antiporter [Alterisphingorhabdus coralli]|uniref:Calcium/sodium antiporter n=1 Tax=Alterisphingorhabdus coralli TaxID=3071408 RepID=A0AA97I1H0_9SPHN|nr:calcium/sodium antiporter [Parasphingorhabdus sp. SCSIO 66989]WOE74735.1 calcium/sodium antiporter [Parasphingorhabdus sp. SCSIO 66989]
MVITVLLLIVGLALLIGGGELLVRGAVRLADRLGVSPLIVSIVIIGFGTSAPELAASIEASRIGSPGIAWGNVIGSNLANSLLILGATATVGRLAVTRAPLWRDGGLVLVATLMLWILASDGNIGRGWGIAMVALLISYLTYAVIQEKRASGATAAGDAGIAHAGSRGVGEGPAEALDDVTDDAREIAIEPETTGLAALYYNYPMASAIIILLVGLGMILTGGSLLVEQAVAIAGAFGLSETLIGITVIAMGTSAPELVTSLVAAWRNQGEIAVGNVMGSNIYNILGIGGTVAILSPKGFPDALITPDLPILMMSAILMILCAATHYSIFRREGMLLLLCYFGYIGWKVVTIAGA